MAWQVWRCGTAARCAAEEAGSRRGGCKQDHAGPRNAAGAAGSAAGPASAACAAWLPGGRVRVRAGAGIIN